MTQRDDLLGRLKELHTGTKAHRATSRVIRAMIFDANYTGAATALDTLENALHPALAAGGGGGVALTSLHDETGGMMFVDPGNTNYFGQGPDGLMSWQTDCDDVGVTFEDDGSPDPGPYFTGQVVLPAGFYLAGGYVDLATNDGTGRVACFVSADASNPVLWPRANLNGGDESYANIADPANAILAMPFLFQCEEGTKARLQVINDTSDQQLWQEAALWFIKL